MEWWYYTGDLETADDRHFGYQLAFFPRGLVPLAERQALFLSIFSLKYVEISVQILDKT